MSRHPTTRILLLLLDGFVALTALAGGTVLVVSSLVPQWQTYFSPPAEYLAGSPFDSYLLPGLALAGILGGVHVLAFVMILRKSRWSVLSATVAAYATMIWIFVQMIFIPFSFLQAVYIVAGLAEVGLVLLVLGVLSPDERAARIAARQGT